MNPEIPSYVGILFILTTLLTVWLFKRALKPKPVVFLLLFIWLAAQGSIAWLGFHDDTMSLPPRFALVILPALLLIAALFISKQGRAWIDALELENLHWVHVVRIPVEITLWLLFIANQIPELMTFEGRNLDIIAGLTAPIVIIYGLRKGILDNQRILLWNIIGIGLLLNIVIMAILSIESPFQQLAFNQPNKAVIQFPFVWLPAFIVPFVLFSHLASLRQLLKK